MSDVKEGSNKATTLRSCTRQYMLETTLHGLRYLIEGWSKPEKLIWVLAIIAAFTYAIYLGVISVMEATDHPVVSVIEMADASDVQFPAVTVYEKVQEEEHVIHHRYMSTFLNLLEFDCTKTDDPAKCRQDTEKVRKDFRPLIEYVVRLVYSTYKEVAEKDKDKKEDVYDNVVNWNITGTYCVLKDLFTDGFTEEEEMKLFDFLADHLMADNWRDEFQEQEFYQLVLNMVTARGMGQDAFNQGLQDFWSNDCDQSKLFGTKLGDWPNVHNVLLHEEYEEAEEFALSDAFELYKHFTDAYWLDDLNHIKTENMPEHLKPLVSVLPDSPELTSCQVYHHALGQCFFGFVNFTKSDTVMGSYESFYCACDEQENSDNKNSSGSNTQRRLSEDTDEFFKALKYATQASSVGIDDEDYLEDMDKLIKEVNYVAKARANWTHPDPKFLHCNFSYVPLEGMPSVKDRKCSFFNRTFTPRGIGYSFNPNVDFLEMYRETSFSRSFDTRMRNKLTPETTVNLENQLDKILDFHIMPNPSHKSYSHLLLIHDPDTFAGKEITLQPGFWYKFTVTPTIVVSDDAVEDIEREKRGCRFPDEPVYEDSLFSTYHRSGCFFECKMRKILDRFGCLPWYFPHFEDPISVCRHHSDYDDEDDEIDEFLKTQFSVDDCDCVSDCNSVSYTKEIMTEPLTYCQYTVDSLWHYGIAFLKGIDETSQMTTQCSYKPNQLTRVTVEMDTTTMQKIHRMKRVSFSDQLGTLGGLMGLFTGMSILSVLEIVVWLGRWLSSKVNNKDEDTEEKLEKERKSQSAWATHSARIGHANLY